MNYFTKLSLALLLLFGLSKTHAQDAANLIPQKSVLVVDFNLKKITEKANYQILEQFYWFNKIDNEIQRDAKEQYEQISKLYKNPTAAGIDTTAHIYFTLYGDSDRFYPALYVPVKDKHKFDKTFMAFKDSERPNNLKTYKGIRYIAKRNDLIIWNEKYFIFIQVPNTEAISKYYEFGYRNEYDVVEPAIIDSGAYNNYGELPSADQPDYDAMEKAYYLEMESNIDKILSLPVNKSVMANSDFKSFKTKVNDIGMWIDLSVFADIYKAKYELYQGLYAPYFKMLSNVNNSYVHSYTNFNKGEIVMDVESIMNSDLTKQTQKFYNNKFNPQLLNYFKKDSLVAFAAMNYNFNEFYNYLSQETKQLTTLGSGIVTSALFEREIKNDPQMIAIKSQIDSLSNIVYPYSRYYDNNDGAAPIPYDEYGAMDSVAVAAPYDYAPADTAIAYEEPVKEEPAKGKKKKEKKEKAPKEKKSKGKKKEVEVVAEENIGELDYTEESNTQNIQPSYEEQQLAQKMLDSLYIVRDSLKKEIALKYLKDIGLTEDDLWHFFKGDFVAGLTRLYYREIKYTSFNYDEEMNSIPEETTRKELTPEYVVAVTVDRKDKLEIFLGLLESKGMLIKEDNIYKIVFNKNMPDNYIFVRDNIFFITNRVQLALTNTTGYATSIGKDPVMSKKILNGPFYMSGDITKSMNIWADNTRRKENKEMIKAVGKNLSQVIYTSSYPTGNVSNAKFKIIMKDQNINSSLGIFRMIEGLFLAERVY